MSTDYSVAWLSHFKSMERAAAKLQAVKPMTVVVIFFLLHLAFQAAAEALLLMLTAPFALVGLPVYLVIGPCRLGCYRRRLHRISRPCSRISRRHAWK